MSAGLIACLVAFCWPPICGAALQLGPAFKFEKRLQEDNHLAWDDHAADKWTAIAGQIVGHQSAARNTTSDVDASGSGFRHLQQAHSVASDTSQPQPTPDVTMEARCRFTKGAWCGQYDKQPTMSPPVVPRGDKLCPKNCSGNGNCNHDSGLCECPAGWTGLDCSEHLRRPCTNKMRDHGFTPHSHIGPDGRDLDLLAPGWMATRCSGICDDTIAACYCDGKYKRIGPPPGSPPGTPPAQYGRQLASHCKLATLKNGSQTRYGKTKWEDLYGPSGWCEADTPKFICGCTQDGTYPPNCDLVAEVFCLNQCNGRGQCVGGFCKCDAGWYGTDCSRMRAGLDDEEGDSTSAAMLQAKPWLSTVVQDLRVVAAAQGTGQLLRPRIYVYDLPPEFNMRLLQYRIGRQHCVYRYFGQENNSIDAIGNVYGLETYLHEVMLQSRHRTYDPETADFFYVPAYTTCLIWPVINKADLPWYYGPNRLRVSQGANFMMEAQRWISRHFPWWNRRGGRDHIWAALHDEGSCWVPTEIARTSIILTHWGRLGLHHESNTAYEPDNYSQPWSHPEWQPQDWRLIIKGHPCYDPVKDLVLPSWKPPIHFRGSPLAGMQQRPREILLAFRGEVGLRRRKHYSRGIRQALYHLSQQHKWEERFNIRIEASGRAKGLYTELLATSKFCLVAPGDGWSARMEDSVLHGCIPVIIMDGVHAVFESLLEYDAFALRVQESDLHLLPDILLAVSAERIQQMQEALTYVWHRFGWASGRYQRASMDWLRSSQDQSLTAPPFLHEDDAFQTLMQWLFSRIQDTR